MRNLIFSAALLLLPAGVHAAPADRWPTLNHQFREARIVPGSGSILERLIRENQDFHLLREGELQDGNPVPVWLRVWWRKSYPGTLSSPQDPAGGYPRVLASIYEWMIAHPDLQPGEPAVESAPAAKLFFEESAMGGGNLRISGAQTSSRSTSDIRVNYWDSNRVIGASNDVSASGRQVQFYSFDGGTAWGQSYLPLVPGDVFQFFPSVDWTSDCTAWAITIGINSNGTSLRLRAYKSTDSGATWVYDGTPSGSHTQADKPMMWVDHSNTSPYKDNQYACWHNGSPQYVNRRTSAGWGTPLQISGAETTGTAIGCDIKTNASGDVFVFWPATGNRRILAARSTNGGTSFDTPVLVATSYDSYDIGVPAFNSRRALIYVSGAAYRTAEKNLVYASWTDLSGKAGCTSSAQESGSNTTAICTTRIWFSRSTNGGLTWSAPARINDLDTNNDQFNPAMVVDEKTGQLAIVYYDTIDDPGRKRTHLYYQDSSDDGQTWSLPLRVTTDPTDETVSGADLGNQYGDYNGLSGIDGVFLPSWTDRRNGGKEEIWTAGVIADVHTGSCPVTVTCSGGAILSCTGTSCTSETGKCVKCSGGGVTTSQFCRGVTGTSCPTTSSCPSP